MIRELLFKLKRNQILKIGIWYLIGNIFNKAFSFITVPIFTRIISQSDFGIFNTYLVFVDFGAAVLGFSLHTAIRNAYRDYPSKLNQLVSSTLCLSTFCFGACSIAVVIGYVFWGANISFPILLLGLLHSYSVAVITFGTTKAIMDMNYRVYAAITIIPNVISTVVALFLVIFVFKDSQYWAKILPLAFTTFITAITIYGIFFAKGKVLYCKEYWKYSFNISAPVVLHSLSQVALQEADRIVITATIGAAATGVYSLIFSAGMILRLLWISFDNVWISWFYKTMNQGRRENVEKYASLYIYFFSILATGVLFVSPEIIKILAPKDYWYATPLVIPVLLSAYFIFLYSIPVNVEYYYKKTQALALNTAFSALIKIALSIVLIPLYGITAAAYTTLIAYIVSFLMHFRISKKIDCDLYSGKIFLAPIIEISIMSIIFYFVMGNWLLRYIIIVIYALLRFSNIYLRIKKIKEGDTNGNN